MEVIYADLRNEIIVIKYAKNTYSFMKKNNNLILKEEIIMIVGEHDLLWKKGAQSIIDSEKQLNEIRLSLKIRNAIEALKELHNIGAVTDEDYKNYLIELITNEGFNLSE